MKGKSKRKKPNPPTEQEAMQAYKERLLQLLWFPTPEMCKMDISEQNLLKTRILKEVFEIDRWLDKNAYEDESEIEEMKQIIREQFNHLHYY